MNRRPVQSSHIQSVGYDPVSRKLEVEFSAGDIYEYANVTVSEYAGLISAKSVGTYFDQRIKNSKTVRKVS